MSRVLRVILDTSTLVSAALRAGSLPDQALKKALRTSSVCSSAETLGELARVLDRRKFDRYLDRDSRRAFVALIRRHTLLFAIRKSDLAAIEPPCRDPLDNQFLALALSCEADALVSSDDDLLTLNPWNGLPILTPAQFVGSTGQSGPIAQSPRLKIL